MTECEKLTFAWYVCHSEICIADNRNFDYVSCWPLLDGLSSAVHIFVTVMKSACQEFAAFLVPHGGLRALLS